MPRKKNPPQIPLPKGWNKFVKSGMIHVFALAQYALIYSRSWAADSSNQRVRLKAENNRLEQELAAFREGTRIKDARMSRLDPKRRPHYLPGCLSRHSTLLCTSSRHRSRTRWLLLSAAQLRL